MKYFLSVILLIGVSQLNAQTIDAKFFDCANGMRVNKGDTMIAIEGSAPGGEYEYVRINRKRGLPADYKEAPLFVYKIHKTTSTVGTNTGFIYVKDSAGEKYELDIERALLSGEVRLIDTSVMAPAGSNLNGYLATNGVLYKPGDYIELNRGAAPDGDFKFIRTNSASLFSYSGTVKQYANSANALPRGYGGHKLKIVRLEKRGNKKIGYVWYAILVNPNIGIVKLEADIEGAIEACEIKPCNKPSPAGVMAPLSPADEIKKLAELRDQGIITEEEFNQQKKKLLQQ